MKNPRLFDPPEQLLLFEPPRVRPRWQDLALEVRRDVVQLMAKMLREHWIRRLKTAAAKEAAHE